MVSYANMKLKVDISTKKIDLENGISIEILKYLPIEEKNNLIENVLQKAWINNIYNPIKLDMYFALYLVYTYSNISFTEKQKEDEYKIYDSLKSNGILDKIIEAIEDDEYNDLYTLLVETEEKYYNYRKSIIGIFNEFSNQVKENSALLDEISKTFNPEQFQNVIDFAQAANGNRPIEEVK